MIMTAFITGLSLAGIWVVVFWLGRSYLVDSFRQNMFALRDEWFDYAREGGISFDHPVYRGLRNILNGYIRFGHRVNLGSVLVFALTLKSPDRRWMADNVPEREWERTVSLLDPEVQQTVGIYCNRMHKLVAKQVIIGSPVLIVTVLPTLLAWLVVRLQIRVIQQAWIRLSSRMDMAALMLGQAA